MEGRITPGNKITATRTNKEREEWQGEGHTTSPKHPPPPTKAPHATPSYPPKRFTLHLHDVRLL